MAVTTEEADLLRAPKLVEMRVAFAAELNSMAEAVTRNNFSLLLAPGSSLSGSVVFDDPRYEEYARNIVNRLAELRGAVSASMTSFSAIEAVPRHNDPRRRGSRWKHDCGILRLVHLRPGFGGIDIVEAEGFRFPSKRRAYVRGPELRAIRDLLLISIDLSNFRLKAAAR